MGLKIYDNIIIYRYLIFTTPTKLPVVLIWPPMHTIAVGGQSNATYILLKVVKIKYQMVGDCSIIFPWL